MTEENKIQYLNALAQYRLARRVQEEISQFLKGEDQPDGPGELDWGDGREFRTQQSYDCVHCSIGLNEIVPDNLLSMFDENELEVTA